MLPKRIANRRREAAYVRRQRLEEAQTADTLRLWSDADREALRTAYAELRGNGSGNSRRR